MNLRAYILELEQALLEAVSHEESLTQGLESRSEIGQAIGILMERHNFSSSEAFEMVKKASQHQNIKLRKIARLVVAEVDGLHSHVTTTSDSR